VNCGSRSGSSASDMPSHDLRAPRRRSITVRQRSGVGPAHRSEEAGNDRTTLNAPRVEIDAEVNLLALQRELRDYTYTPGRLTCFVTDGPKPPEVFAADFRDPSWITCWYHHLERVFRRGHGAAGPGASQGRVEPDTERHAPLYGSALDPLGKWNYAQSHPNRSPGPNRGSPWSAARAAWQVCGQPEAMRASFAWARASV
jgi:hypothetical protein